MPSMAKRKSKKSEKTRATALLAARPLDDKGSEASYGIDYQWHLAARLCIEMLQNKDVQAVICEFHQDIVRVDSKRNCQLVQVKKHERPGPWRLSELLTPTDVGSLSAIGKLFLETRYKDVNQLVICSHGRAGDSEDLSLYGLICLLDVPLAHRDEAWNNDLRPYENLFCTELSGQGLTDEEIKRAIRLLRVDLSLPDPGAVEVMNRDYLIEVIESIWDVKIDRDTATYIYDELYKHVKRASVRVKVPVSERTLTRAEIIHLIDRIVREEIAAPDVMRVLTLKEKFDEAGFHQDQVLYAFNCRLDAMQTKYELDIDSSQWRDFKDHIHIEWEKHLGANPFAKKVELWQSLRNMLSLLADEWSKQGLNLDLKRSFAEGVFFDMAATCEARMK